MALDPAQELLYQLLDQDAAQVLAWLRSVELDAQKTFPDFNWIIFAEKATLRAQWPHWQIRDTGPSMPDVAWAEIAVRSWAYLDGFDPEADTPSNEAAANSIKRIQRPL